MPKIRKRSSKRCQLKTKYLVDKKVKDHKRKIKKEARKLKQVGIVGKKIRKEPGIPNLFPHKEEMLNALDRKEKIDDSTRENLKSMRTANQNLPTGDIQSFALEAKQKCVNFKNEEEKYNGLTKEEIEEAEKYLDPNARHMNQSRKAYYKELKKVVEASDVIIQVLDARDPEGCRSKELEDQVLSQNKKLLLVVNKIDLIPAQNARQWQRYFRREFPCVLFKANKQNQSENLSGGNSSLHKNSMAQNSQVVESMINSSSAVGTENLMNILKNYARVEGDAKSKQLIYVGVVGFPNVGKSSLINSLKRSRAAAVGNTPGVTKTMQEIQLDKNIVLMDSPGVVLASKEQTDSLILRSAIKVEDLPDPMRPVEALLGRIDKQELLVHYRIADFDNIDSFIGQVARKKGFLQNKGVPNVDQTARAVIRDYMQGKLKYFTAPPEFDDDVMDQDMQ